MANFSIKMKKRKNAMRGFHAQYIDRTTEVKRSPLGARRTFGSATTLIIGGAMTYIALHYVPAYLGLNKILSFSDLKSNASISPESSQWAMLSSYGDAFRLKRTYLRAGQTIQAQYALPQGAKLDLVIQKCRPAFIVEIFNCQVLSEETAQVINDKDGTQRFVFPESGFYRFDEKITFAPNNVQNYRVIWSRV
jgi:hypothetical protein